MPSETSLLWLARLCQAGGSLGFRARDLADRIRLQDPSMMVRPADVMGSWAARALWLILAGMPANSGELAKVVRLSTASTSGRVASPHLCRFTSFGSWSSTLISLTRLAVALATSLADCTKWRLATGFMVLEEATRQALQSDDVCLAITVAADRICGWLLVGLESCWQAIWMAWLARAKWARSTRPGLPATLEASDAPTRYAACAEDSTRPQMADDTSLTLSPNCSCSLLLAWLAMPVMASPRLCDFSITVSRQSK
uniref:Uncharacterized protein n=1 Tax=Ixodes ricinus TaxID=34613 RepID=A0A6B0V5L9_IXORI